VAYFPDLFGALRSPFELRLRQESRVLAKKLLSIGEDQTFNIVREASTFLRSSAMGNGPDCWFDAKGYSYPFIFSLGSHFAIA
jgi:hypothetical protein